MKINRGMRNVGCWTWLRRSARWRIRGGAAPQQVTGGAHRSRIARGLWAHTASKQGGNLLRIALVVFGLAAVKRACIERACPRTKGRPSAAQRSASQYQVKRHSTATTKPSRSREADPGDIRPAFASGEADINLHFAGPLIIGLNAGETNHHPSRKAYRAL